MDGASTSSSAVSGCKRKRSAGRQKIPIELIQNKPALQVCFTKRRQGLFKKARELADQFGAHIQILVFSPAGKPFSFIHPPNSPIVDYQVSILDRPLELDRNKSTLFQQRKATLLKKARELSILCGIDLCATVCDGPSNSNPAFFSSVSDVSSPITRFSNLSEKEKQKGMTKQIEAKKAELARTEMENRVLEIEIMLQGVLEGRLELPHFWDNEVSNMSNSLPVPCASMGYVDGWTVPAPVPVSVNLVGPLGEIMGLQNCAMDESVQLSDLVGQSSCSVGSLSDVVGSSCVDSQTDVGFNGSIGSDARSLDSTSQEWIDMDEWIDSSDIGPIESLLVESIGFVGVESDKQELSVSDFIGFDGLEDEVVPMELLYDPSEVTEASHSGSELESCVDERECFAFSDFDFDFLC